MPQFDARLTSNKFFQSEAFSVLSVKPFITLTGPPGKKAILELKQHSQTSWRLRSFHLQPVEILQKFSVFCVNILIGVRPVDCKQN